MNEPTSKSTGSQRPACIRACTECHDKHPDAACPVVGQYDFDVVKQKLDEAMVEIDKLLNCGDEELGDAFDRLSVWRKGKK